MQIENIDENNFVNPRYFISADLMNPLLSTIQYSESLNESIGNGSARNIL
jgi:hypothetical protein